MTTLVVYESMWGNTEAVARAIAEGLGESSVLTDVALAPREVAADVRLLVIGGPTHAFSLSRPSTRRDAVRQGAAARNTDRGIREWLDSLSRSEQLDIATFDTKAAKAKHLPGSAANKAGRKVRRSDLGHLIGTRSFYVEDIDGPLLAGELERARDWGARLAAHADAYR